MKYKIKVNIEVVECDESEQCGLVESKDGKFTKIVNENEAASIDHWVLGSNKRNEIYAKLY